MSMSATATSTVAPATSQPPPSNNGGGGGSGPTSSPLLFFVALGFGVVFTNLWIIVGVKYCFRYNQRNRAARAAADGEPIDLTAMPRPHRRRREKKLMTMDEVNERFPLIKYKQWKSSRENQGLPAAGGISTAPPSRAASIKDVESISQPIRDDGASSPRPDTALSATKDELTPKNEPVQEQTSTNPVATENEKEKEKHDTTVELTSAEHYQPNKDPARNNSHDADDSDDDDPIRTATAPELLGEPGDSCAICLDTLEDDDDVRGLTCGHAFHASCVDPWLTSRRACCPLCKADYYVPKPRPEGEAADPSATGRRSTGTGLRSPTSPQAVWTGGRFSRSRVVFINTGNGQDNGNARPPPPGLHSLFSRPRRRDRNPESIPSQQPTQADGSSWSTRLPFFGRGRANDTNAGTDTTTPSVPPQQPTPGQLEAGNR
ncbi:RING-8 protein [Dendryphion nanum]|uniref:RING-8 protein n=1 Tax=Dendryphion nanum TaxID=256645 RepID=A0A9P9IKG5_9PLEO|nr:RING-8 protein [Dendryphion nanum]